MITWIDNFVRQEAGVGDNFLADKTTLLYMILQKLKNWDGIRNKNDLNKHFICISYH